MADAEINLARRGVNFIDMTGGSFGHLTVLREDGKDAHGLCRWLCQCACGNLSRVDGNSLRRGKTRSCGCRSASLLRASRNAHGCGELPEYKIWKAMRQRCNNKNNRQYDDYGGRGIKVCNRWAKFPNFFEDMGKRPTPSHCIERIDNDGPYISDNCKWATQSEQAKNRRTSIAVTIDGETRNLTDWIDKFGIKYSTVTARIRKGMPPTEALMRKVK